MVICKNEKKVKFLIIDDDIVDMRAIRRGMKKCNITNPVVEATNGLHGLEVLRGTPEQPPLATPFVILLDLNMPQMSGIEFLEQLRSDPKLKHHIVFVLTTSSDDQDMLKAYEKNVAGYILKSEAGENFFKVIQMMEKFIVTIQFPPEA